MTAASAYLAALDDWQQILPSLRSLSPVVETVGQTFVACWKRGGKVIFAGNGGSAADAMHFAEELVVRFCRNRRALASMALLDSAMITCAGNDLGYDQIFARQLDALGRPEDVFVGITTSGNSANILLAMEAARERGMKTVSFLGKDGGKLKGRCDVEVLVPMAATHRVQEVHKLLFHALCVWIDEIAETI